MSLNKNRIRNKGKLALGIILGVWGVSWAVGSVGLSSGTVSEAHIVYSPSMLLVSVVILSLVAFVIYEAGFEQDNKISPGTR